MRLFVTYDFSYSDKKFCLTYEMSLCLCFEFVKKSFVRNDYIVFQLSKISLFCWIIAWPLASEFIGSAYKTVEILKTYVLWFNGKCPNVINLCTSFFNILFLRCLKISEFFVTFIISLKQIRIASVCRRSGIFIVNF